MNLRTLWLAVALGASPLVANAQISADVSFNWSSSAPGEPVASVDVFYDQLSPYGVWIDDPTVGQAFIPDQSDYVPYTNGHWENTDVGFVWISDEPFAWATSHYGRWWFSNDYGRWVWVPDTTWGPSWVDWYEAGDDIGWAPLAPDVVVSAGYQVPLTAYHYCPGDRILDTDVRRYYVPRDRVEVIHRQARPVAHRATIGSHQVIAGPAPERLAAHHVRVAQVRHVDPKQMGRMTQPEARAAEQRAQQRKPQIEQQNAKRLQAHTEIQKVVQQRQTKAPAHGPNDNHVDTHNRGNDVDRSKEPNLATPNAANPRPDVNRRDDRDTTRPDNRDTTRPDNRDTNRPEPQRTAPTRPDQQHTPARTEPTRPEPTRPEAQHNAPTPPPARPEATRPEPQRAEPTRPEAQHNAPTPREATPREPTRPDMTRPEPTSRPEPQRAEPTRPQPTSRPEPQRAEPARPEPTSRPEPQRAEPARPEPMHAEPRPEPQHTAPTRPEPQHAAPPRGEPHAPPAHDHNKDKH